LSTDHPVDELAAGKHQQCWNPLDLILAGQLLELIDVDFQNGRVGVGSQRLDGWFHHLTRSTPVGIEVDEHGLVGLDGRLEVCGIAELDRFGRNIC